jgi:hypothetical protein
MNIEQGQYRYITGNKIVCLMSYVLTHVTQMFTALSSKLSQGTATMT